MREDDAERFRAWVDQAYAEFTSRRFINDTDKISANHANALRAYAGMIMMAAAHYIRGLPVEIPCQALTTVPEVLYATGAYFEEDREFFNRLLGRSLETHHDVATFGIQTSAALSLAEAVGAAHQRLIDSGVGADEAAQKLKDVYEPAIEDLKRKLLDEKHDDK